MKRIRSLDSLRGLAALAVVFYHYSLVYPGVYPALMRVFPLRLAISGEAAVRLFFVLSGFVLYLSLDRTDRDDPLAFILRRLIRLWPPVVVAVMLSFLLYLAFDKQPPPVPGWLSTYSWTEAPSLWVIAGHILMLDTDRSHMLDNPIWSLVVEIRLSLIFPLLAACVRRRPIATALISFAISWECRRVMMDHHVSIVDPILTASFLDLFTIGAILARYRKLVATSMHRVPLWLAIAVVWILICRRGRFDQISTYVGVTTLIAMSFSHAGVGRLYAMKPVVWLGERSFSLYLIHVPVLLAVVHATAGSWPIAASLAVSFGLCLIGTEAMWLVIERPSITASRWAGHRLRLRSVPTP